MNLKHFGDSYDIVKKSLLQWLAAFGPWGAHPMFTHAVTDAEADAFSRFLGVGLVSTEVLTRDTDRGRYLDACRDCRSIFLDPDTGVRLQHTSGERASEYILGDELIDLALARAQGLVLTFDQSLARGREATGVQTKLDYFSGRGIDGFAYVSHASFLVLGQSSALIRAAREQVLASSGLPSTKIMIATQRPVAEVGS